MTDLDPVYFLNPYLANLFNVYSSFVSQGENPQKAGTAFPTTYKDLFYQEPIGPERKPLYTQPIGPEIDNPYNHYSQSIGPEIDNPYYNYYDQPIGPVSIPNLYSHHSLPIGPEINDQYSSYSRQIGPEFNEISQQAAAWGSSLPGLLIKFGVPGLLGGGLVYGGYKAYQWWANKKNKARVDAGVNKEPEEYSSNDGPTVAYMNPTEMEMSQKIKNLTK